MKMEINIFFFCTSGDGKAVLTVYHAFVDPQGVPSLHVTQSAVAHLTLSNTNKHSHEGRDTLSFQLFAS